MTDPVCPINNVPAGAEVCNTCISNGCSNCKERCLNPATDCNRVFNLENQNMSFSGPISTAEVSFATSPSLDISPDSSNPNQNYLFPGVNYVCSVDPDQTSYRVSGEPVPDEDSLNISIEPDGYSHDGSTGRFNATINYTDNSPTNAVNPTELQSGFKLNTANESFVLLQDIYAPIFNEYKRFHNQQEGLAPIDFDFYSLRNLDSDSLARNLFHLVKGIYRMQMVDIKSSNLDKKSKRDQLKNLRQDIDRHRVIIEDLKAVNATSKRNIEINLNKTRRMEDTNKVLMIVMILIGIMIIVPILKKTEILPLNISLGIWCVLLLIILGYMVYELYMKRANIDELEYKKRNFAKPTDKEIAKSRAMAQLSDKDKARCQAFSELEQELDVPNINIDVSQYYSQPQAADSCAHIPDN